MRAREADVDGYVEHEGVKIHYEVYGDGTPTVLLLPTWTIVHKRFWKAQIGPLARHVRLVTYDGPGNGRSDRPLEPAAYHHDTQVAYALAVLEATGTQRAVCVALSRGCSWALALAADHPDRVLGTVYMGARLGLVATQESRATAQVAAADVDELARSPSSVPLGGCDPPSDWRKHRIDYVQETRRTTCGSSSASAFRSRTRRSRSRTACGGASTRRRPCWPLRPPAGRIPTGQPSRRRAPACRVRPS